MRSDHRQKEVLGVIRKWAGLRTEIPKMNGRREKRARV